MTNDVDSELDFAYYLDILIRRRWVGLSVCGIIVFASILRVFTAIRVYQAQTLLVIEKERGSGLSVSAAGDLIEASNDDYYQTQYKLLKSDSLLERVYDDLHLERTPDFAPPDGVRKLKDAIEVSPIIRSRLLYVRADSTDPALTARIANTLTNRFVEQNLGNQLFISKDVLRALQVPSDGSNTKILYDSIPAVVNNPLIQQLKAEYAKQEALWADLSKRYTEKHPALIEVRAHMDAIQAQIRVETERIVQSLKTELSGQLKGNNVRIVDPARVPDKPYKPHKRRDILLGLLAGIVLGVGVIFLIERLDQSIRTQDDVQTKLGLSFLGLVPYSLIKSNACEAVLSKELSVTSEAFRNLRTMVNFAIVGEKSNSLLVTSSVQEEGKSYVAINLAVVFAQLGENVLIVDGDMRRPSLHRKLGIANELGLSNYLAGSENISGLSKRIQVTDIPRLSALTCGPIPPNPSELLNTPRLSALVAWAQSSYDRVIIDCTPAFPVSDTLLWGRHIRDCVFLVRFGFTRVPLIMKAVHRLSSGGIKILGAVINAGKVGEMGYYHYHHYYQAYQTAEGSIKA